MAEHTDELRALRARAYGPEADIQDDPAALQRLQELEALERAIAAPAVTTTAIAPAVELIDQAETPAAPVDEPAAESTAAADEDAADIPASPPEPAPLPWWRRRITLLWAGSLVIAALLGGAAALSLQAITAGRAAVLQEDSTRAWPEGFFGGRPPGARMFTAFHGLTVVALPEQFGPTDTECMYVIAEPTNAMVTAGCTAGSFPAVASLVVSPESPDELLERFGEGAALQFVLDGSQVTVYSATR